MDHMLTEVGLRMTYLRDPYEIDELDQESILRDLSEGQVHDPEEDLATSRLGHRNLSDYSHLILASDHSSTRAMAILGMYHGSTGQEAFLHLQTAYVAPVARGRRMMDRMVALALLRIASFGPVPQVIVARIGNPVWYRSLRLMSRRFTGAVFFPDHDSVAIRLDSVRVAQRLAGQIAPNLRFETATAALRGGRATPLRARPTCKDLRIEALFGESLRPADQILTMIDLRTETEDTILDDARRIYRTR